MSEWCRVEEVVRDRLAYCAVCKVKRPYFTGSVPPGLEAENDQLEFVYGCAVCCTVIEDCMSFVRSEQVTPEQFRTAAHDITDPQIKRLVCEGTEKDKLKELFEKYLRGPEETSATGE